MAVAGYVTSKSEKTAPKFSFHLGTDIIKDLKGVQNKMRKIVVFARYIMQ